MNFEKSLQTIPCERVLYIVLNFLRINTIFACIEIWGPQHWLYAVLYHLLYKQSFWKFRHDCKFGVFFVFSESQFGTVMLTDFEEIETFNLFLCTGFERAFLNWVFSTDFQRNRLNLISDSCFDTCFSLLCIEEREDMSFWKDFMFRNSNWVFVLWDLICSNIWHLLRVENTTTIFSVQVHP